MYLVLAWNPICTYKHRACTGPCYVLLSKVLCFTNQYKHSTDVLVVEQTEEMKKDEEKGKKEKKNKKKEKEPVKSKFNKSPVFFR